MEGRAREHFRQEVGGMSFVKGTPITQKAEGGQAVEAGLAFLITGFEATARTVPHGPQPEFVE